ncbi:MAG: glycosyltransferase family 4 protein [Methanosarcina mazei]
MKVSQVIISVGRGGWSFGQIAYYLNKEFIKKEVDSALICGYLSDSLDKKTELHFLNSRLVQKKEEVHNSIIQRLINLLAEPIFHISSFIYVKKHKASLGFVIDHAGIAGDFMLIHGCVHKEIMIRLKSHDLIFLVNPLFYYRYLLEICRFYIKKPIKYIVVSKRLKQEIMDIYKIPSKDIVIIPNGVDLERFNPEKAFYLRDKVRYEYNIPLDSNLLLFVAHNFWLKGLTFVIKALENLTNCYLLVVGSGIKKPFESLANELGIKSRVIFTGSVHDVSRFYVASDIFVYPSSYDVFSLVCMEALASGLPVLSTRVGGVEDYLIEGKSGYFITQDPEDIAKKVNLILSDRNLINEFRENARKTAEKFDWNKIADKYIDLARGF